MSTYVIQFRIAHGGMLYPWRSVRARSAVHAIARAATAFARVDGYSVEIIATEQAK